MINSRFVYVFALLVCGGILSAAKMLLPVPSGLLLALPPPPLPLLLLLFKLFKVILKLLLKLRVCKLALAFAARSRCNLFNSFCKRWLLRRRFSFSLRHSRRLQKLKLKSIISTTWRQILLTSLTRPAWFWYTRKLWLVFVTWNHWAACDCCCYC